MTPDPCGSYLVALSAFGGALSATIGGSNLPKESHILVSLVQPSDLPPETDAEVTIQADPDRVHATLRCSSGQAARACFAQMLDSIQAAYA